MIDLSVARKLLVPETDPVDRRRGVLALAPAGREIVADPTVTGHAGARAPGRAGSTEQDQLRQMLMALLAGWS